MGPVESAKSSSLRTREKGLCFLTSRVGSPDVNVSASVNGLAGVDVDQLKVEPKRDTFLVLGEVEANVFVCDVVRTLGDLRNQDAGAVGVEERLRANVRRGNGEVGSVLQSNTRVVSGM